MPPQRNDTPLSPDDKPPSFRDRLPSLDDNAPVKFRDIGDWLEELPNTISTRYFSKVLQAHEGLSAPALQIAPGKPTGYAARAIAHFLDCGKDLTKYREQLEQLYPKPSTVAETAAVQIYQPPAPLTQTVPEQLNDRALDAEDNRLRVLAKVAITIEAFKAQSQQLQETEDQELYETAFTEEFDQLGDGLRKKMLAQQAKLNARKLFQEQMETDD